MRTMAGCLTGAGTGAAIGEDVVTEATRVSFGYSISAQGFA